MMTQRMRGQLKELGYSAEAVGAMTPGDAWRILREGLRPIAGGAGTDQLSESGPQRRNATGWSARL